MRQGNSFICITISAIFLLAVLHTSSPGHASEGFVRPSGVDDLLPIIGEEGELILGFGSPTWAAFSDDSNRFLTFSSLGLIQWTIENGVPNPIDYHPRDARFYLSKFQYAPGKNWIVAHESFAMTVFDLDANEVVYTITDNRPPDEISISSDGRFLVYYDAITHSIVLFDIEEGETIETIPSETEAHPTFSLDDRRIYRITTTETEPHKYVYSVQRFNIETKTVESEYSFADGTVSISNIAIAPFGYLAYSEFKDSSQNIHIFDINQKQEILSFTLNDNTIPAVVFSPDGKHLALGTHGTPSFFMGTSIYSKGIPPQLYNLETGERIELENNIDGGIEAVVFSPDGKYFFTNGFDNTLRLWSVPEKKLVGALPGFCDFFSGAVFSPDSRTVLSCSGGTFSEDATVKQWELERGANVRTYSGHAAKFVSIAYSPNGDIIAAGSIDGTAKIWDAQTGNESLALNGEQQTVNALQFSPDGKTLATGGEDGSIALWDASSGALKTSFELYGGSVQCMAYSPNGQYLLTGSKSAREGELGLTLLWDVETSEIVREYFYDSKTHTVSVAFSADGRSVIAGFSEQQAVVWDFETGEQRHVFNQHSGGVFDVSFSPKGDYISTGSGDNHARIFPIDSDGPSHSVYLSGTAVISKISPDGNKWLVNNTVREIGQTTPVEEWMVY